MAAKTVDEYLAALPPEQRKALSVVRKTVKAAAPDAIEKIGWRVPMYSQHGMLVSFAAFKDHLSFMPMDPAVVERYEKEVAPYRSGKVALHFTPEKPIPAALVRTLVEACVAANKERAAKKAARRRKQ